jgi:hypothetical protein
MRTGFGIGVIVLVATMVAHAGDPALPLTITSGYNADIVAEGAGSAGSTTSTMFDASGNVFYDSTYDAAHGNNGGALPAGQTINDWDGNQYTLAPAAGNNALIISSENTSGTLGISYADNASLTGLLLLGTSAAGDTILNYTLNFSGGITSSGSFTFADWHNSGASGTFNSFGRISLLDEYNSETGRAFSLYVAGIAIPEEDALLRLDSISLGYDAGNVDDFGIFPRAAILGVSAFDPIIAPVPEPASSSLALCGALVLAGAAARKFFKN